MTPAPALPILYVSIIEPCPICGNDWEWDAEHFTPPIELNIGVQRSEDVLWCHKCGFVYIETTKTCRIPRPLEVPA